MTAMRLFPIMLLVTAMAAGLAGWGGVSYGLRQSPPDLDRVLHEQLDLTGEQRARIESLEAAMTEGRQARRAEMMAANRDLASALARDHAYGPAEKAAIAHFHAAMMALQEDMVRHVMAMRAVLNPDQARRFDAVLAKNLTDATP
jgi:Spy/CpxP family protein refolding chaperone